MTAQAVRDILKQADTLAREADQVSKALLGVTMKLSNATTWSISVGDGWFAVSEEVMRAIESALTDRYLELNEQIEALEARVQVVES